jgi:UDP-glucose 4-epimerase
VAEVNQAASRFEGASVLVTGGSGFIGSHLVEALAGGGARVTVLDNLQAGRWDNLEAVRARVECVEGDVRDASEVQRLVAAVRPRFVFHLAANASVPGSVQDPSYDFEANALGTFVVLNALRLASGCDKAVVASSGAVYGEPVSFPIGEEDPLKPISPYGASKLSTEVSCRMFHRVYQIPVTIARLFNAYGPRMARFVVLDFLRKLSNDPTLLEVLGTGKQVRDFTYVADTVQGLLLLALTGSPGEAYNVSSGANHSVTELAHRLIAVRGLAGKTEIAYTGTSWVGDAQRWEVSIEKLRGLGYAPAYTLDQGLRRTQEWFDGQHQNI